MIGSKGGSALDQGAALPVGGRRSRRRRRYLRKGHAGTISCLVILWLGVNVRHRGVALGILFRVGLVVFLGLRRRDLGRIHGDGGVVGTLTHQSLGLIVPSSNGLVLGAGPGHSLAVRARPRQQRGRLTGLHLLRQLCLARGLDRRGGCWPAGSCWPLRDPVQLVARDRVRVETVCAIRHAAAPKEGEEAAFLLWSWRHGGVRFRVGWGCGRFCSGAYTVTRCASFAVRS